MSRLVSRKGVMSFSSRKLLPELERLGEELGMVFKGYVLYELIQEDLKKIKKYLIDMKSYDYILIASKNAVEMLLKSMKALRIGLERLPKVIVVGNKTREYCESLGLRVQLCPEEYSTEGIKKLLKDWDLKGRSFLIPKNNLSGKDLKDWILERGGEVRDFILYKNKKLGLGSCEKEEIKSFNGEYLLFTSSSSVKYFFEEFPLFEIFQKQKHKKHQWIGFGSKSYASLLEKGLKKVIRPKESSLESLKKMFMTRYKTEI